MADQRSAKLRCCCNASCEWIFKSEDGSPECPRCGFGSYGARYVHGEKAYKFARTQEPFFMHKLGVFLDEFSKEYGIERKHLYKNLWP